MKNLIHKNLKPYPVNDFRINITNPQTSPVTKLAWDRACIQLNQEEHNAKEPWTQKYRAFRMEKVYEEYLNGKRLF